MNVAFFRPLRLGLLFCAASTIPAATINIGVFNSTQTATALGAASTASPVYATSGGLNNAPLGLGGQREFIVRKIAGTGPLVMDIDTYAEDALTFFSGPGVQGRGLIIWDGPDAVVDAASAKTQFDPTSATPSVQRGQPNSFGLTGSGATGGVDLTDSGTNNAITIMADADNVGLPVIFHFYRAPGVFATATLNVPGNTGELALKFHAIRFTSFATSGLSSGESALDIFKDVKAITMQIDGRNSSDAQFDNLRAQYVPEPMSFALVGAGLIGLGIFRQRK